MRADGLHLSVSARRSFTGSPPSQMASDSSPEMKSDAGKVCHSRLKLNHTSLRRCFHSSACPRWQEGRRRRTWAAEGYIYKSQVMLPRRLRRGLPTSLHHCNLSRAAETLKRLRAAQFQAQSEQEQSSGFHQSSCSIPSRPLIGWCRVAEMLHSSRYLAASEVSCSMFCFFLPPAWCFSCTGLNSCF